jgi:hypothetical protein
MTKVYRVELLIVDHDSIGIEGIKSAIENARYPNRCIAPAVMMHESQDVEWSDEHPLNNYSTMLAEYLRMFSDK